MTKSQDRYPTMFFAFVQILYSKELSAPSAIFEKTGWRGAGKHYKLQREPQPLEALPSSSALFLVSALRSPRSQDVQLQHKLLRSKLEPSDSEYPEGDPVEHQTDSRIPHLPDMPIRTGFQQTAEFSG